MIIRTRRLLLRPHFPEDARALYAAIADERVVRMLSRAPWPYHMEHAEAFCARGLDPQRLNFAVTLPEWRGAPIIGGVGIDLEGDVAELGYWITPDFWGQGFASEAVAAVLEKAALLGIPHVEARHFIDNLASGGVLLKTGFAPTGEIVDVASMGRGGEVVSALGYIRVLSRQQDAELSKAA